MTVRGSQLVAVVGGEVEYYSDDPLLGPIQPDGGGYPDVRGPDTGAEAVLPGAGSLVFRRPAFRRPAGNPFGWSWRATRPGATLPATPS